MTGKGMFVVVSNGRHRNFEDCRLVGRSVVLLDMIEVAVRASGQTGGTKFTQSPHTVGGSLIEEKGFVER